MKIIERSNFGRLIELLKEAGYEVYGPRALDGGLVYDHIEKDSDLPEGYKDQQGKGLYRLEKSGDPYLFGFAVGSQSWKKFLHPAEQRLWKAKKTGNGFTLLDPEPEPRPRMAFIGVRACEISAMTIQQKVYEQAAALSGNPATPDAPPFIVTVNCTHPSNNCFCTSMDTGPRVRSGFDISLTEILEDHSHYFIGESGSERGADLLAQIPSRQATAAEISRGKAATDKAAQSISRSLDTHGLKELLYQNYNHPSWEAVADRCLSCGNCTMVCPTCFCSSVEDTIDVTGQYAERWNKWDSCFSIDFSYIHGGPVRNSVKSRYRQWMTHKLATWIDQFGTSGCVGCGRCITWCPVGIDITEEASTIRNSPKTQEP